MSFCAKASIFQFIRTKTTFFGIFCTKTRFYSINSSDIFHFSDDMARQQVENVGPARTPNHNGGNEFNPALAQAPGLNAEGQHRPDQSAGNEDQIKGTFI